MTTSHETHAVVVGAGIAGLLAARVLSDHVDRITIVERTRADDATGAAPSEDGRWPACRLAPTTLAMLEARVPGIAGDLLRAGAVPLASDERAAHAQRSPGGMALGASHRLVRNAVRRRVLHERDRISILDGIEATGVTVGLGGVREVRLDGGALEAGLVVDASGTSASMLGSATDGDALASSIPLGMEYRTRLFARDGDAPARGEIVEDRERGRRCAVLTPIEGARWALTLGAWRLDDAPATQTEIVDALIGLGAFNLAELASTHPVRSSIGRHRLDRTVLRRPHLDRRLPPGLIVVGDALCTGDPVRSPGAPSAITHAHLLSTALAMLPPGAPELASTYHGWVARPAASWWRGASGADAVVARPRGPLPRRVTRSLRRAEAASAARGRR